METTEQECNHKYRFLRTAKKVDNDGGYNTHYIRIDYFYCEQCLHYKEVKQETYSRDTPDWYR